VRERWRCGRAAVLAVYVGEVPGKPLACAVALAGAWSLGYDRNLFNRLRQMEFCVDLSDSGVDARSTTFAGIGIHEAQSVAGGFYGYSFRTTK
jgi:hypothetical protein